MPVTAREVVENLGPLAVMILLLAGAILLLRPKPEFVVTIRKGKVTLKKGKVSGRFLEDCEQLCAEHGIQTGKVWGYRTRRHTSIRFSSGISREHHQRFRNVWNLNR